MAAEDEGIVCREGALDMIDMITIALDVGNRHVRRFRSCATPMTILIVMLMVILLAEQPLH